MRILLSFALIFPLAAFGQLDDNTLTVTSSRSLSFQPDQVVISVTAGFESTAALDDVLTAVQSAGITAANLADGSTFSAVLGLGAAAQQQTTEWFFVVQVPFSKLSSELAALVALQKSIGKNPLRSLSFNVQGTQVSPQLSTSVGCPYAALFQDAGVQAHALASAAGVMLGAVVAVSDGTGSYPVLGAAVVARSPYFAVNTAVSFVGGLGVYQGQPTGFSYANFFLGALSTQAPPAPNCSLSVQFRLLH